MPDLHPTCVATTGDAFCRPLHGGKPTGRQGLPKENRESKFHEGQESALGARREQRYNLFRSAQFSGDGTTLITQNEDQQLRAFVLPTDLLDAGVDDHERDDGDTASSDPFPNDSHFDNSQLSSPKHTLTPYTAYATAGSPIQSYAIYPYFSLGNADTTAVLCARAHAPITLRNALSPSWSAVHATYRFESATTEAQQFARSLHFSRDGTYFVAGGDNVLAVFASARDGAGPVAETRLKGRQRGVRDLVRCRGSVLALGVRAEDGLLAAGTSARGVALWEHEGRGECVTGFELGRGHVVLDGGGACELAGSGITSMKWTPCGRYLILAERQSTSLLVYDIRHTRGLVAVLTGRAARTQQRLDFDILPEADAAGLGAASPCAGCTVWAGGTDGRIQMWRAPGTQAVHAPDASFAAHGSPVSGVAWHPGGAVLATCAGAYAARGREVMVGDGEDEWGDGEGMDGLGEGEGREAVPDNTMKIWTV